MFKSFEEFFRQFRVMAWKNAILKIRYCGTLLLEVAVPTIIIIALGVLSNVIPATSYDQSIPYTYLATPSFRYNDPNNVFGSKDMCFGNQNNNIVWSCVNTPNNRNYCNSTDNTYSQLLNAGCAPKKIAVAPATSGNAATTLAAQNFVTWANSNSLFESKSTYVFFSSEGSFNNYIGQSGYAKSSTIQVFSSAVIIQSAAPAWSYSLRFNQSYDVYTVSSAKRAAPSMPPTSGPAFNLVIKSNQQDPSGSGGASGKGGGVGRPNSNSYMAQFGSMGVVALGDVVNSYIATLTCRNRGVNPCSPNQDVEITTEGGVDFPSDKVTLNAFWSSIGFVFALLMILTLLYPIANVIRALVQEKETKMKEGMMMMALRGDVHYWSWLFNFMCLFVPLAIILTIAGKPLFKYSDGTYIFFYFMLFFMSATSFAYLMSNFFSRALTAAIVGIVLFFGGYFIFIALVTGNNVNNGTKSQYMAASLHPATAFCFGTLAFTEWEGSNIGVTKNTWNVSNLYPITFQDSLTMMFIDTIWIAILSWYISNIWPSEFGTHLPWYFIFNPYYWWGCMKYCFGMKNAPNGSRVFDELQDSNVPVEPVAESLTAQIAQNKCVDIRDLYKEFDTNSGSKVAVDGLSMTMFSGQITALLGHNGAGKSTTISILTGLIEPSGGTAIIEGMDIRTDLSDIRRNLGVCPQHDVLFPDLTVEEHLVLFAAFKGAKGPAMRKEVEDMIRSVGLTEKRKAYSKTLSGGQKRKLSVGIAFIGGSRVVFLDEPTSGMDPYSRRFTWNIIKQHKENRVIVLTTHFMDEADLLGDRIAIMGDGKLKCCGSSLFLKNHYGVGYNMVVEKADPNNFDSKKVKDLINSYVAEAKVLTDAGAEISFQLPLSSSGSFQPLFDYLDDNGQNELGVRSYGMSVTTLEEVFIKVAEGTDTQLTAIRGREIQAATSLDKVDYKNDPNPNSEGKEDNHTIKLSQVEINKQRKPASIFPDIFRRKDASDDVEAGGGNMKNVTFSKIDDKDRFAFFLRHMEAMILKRAFYFSRDRKAWVFQYLLPLVVVLIGLIIMVTSTIVSTQPSLTMQPSLYNGGVSSKVLPSNYNNASYFCLNNNDCLSTVNPSNGQVTGHSCCSNTTGAKTTIMKNIPGASNFPIIPNNQGVNILAMSNKIFAEDNSFQASQVGALSFFNQTNHLLSYFLYTNYSAVWATPLYQYLLATGYIETIDSTASVTMAYAPLPLTQFQIDRLTSFNTDLVATFISLAIPWVAASYASYVVREREAKSKNQQLVSGVTLYSYWFANWIWDFISYQLTLWGIVFLVAVFPQTGPLSSTSSGALNQFIILMTLFGTSISGFSYLLSFLFKTPSGAQVVVVFIVFCTGLILSVVGIVLRLLLNDLYMKVLRYVFCIFPPFALVDALHNMCTISFYSAIELGGNRQYAVTDWEITGLNIVFLGWETAAYLILTILYEYWNLLPSFYKLCCSCCGATSTLPLEDEVKDDDVLAEEKRVKDGELEDSSILVKDVKKVYPGGKYAVRGVSLGIPNGECFGLLGINGAGKSSTLAMLSGEFEPTEGEAFVAGLSLSTNVHEARRKIGFCPQFDALFDLLTGREHLELYARIQGVVEKDINKVVNAKIAEMGLTEYASRSAYTYSGGNKRKLSVAIAMMGEPSIVFLDEPSTGMDPVARRFMWQVISDIVTKREKCSLILTTHSMEECEALCTRIGIMVGGVLRCLGSSQRLRNKYGHGYQIEIGMVLPTSDEIQRQATKILEAMNISSVTLEDGSDILITKIDNVRTAFITLGKSEWLSRVEDEGSAVEIMASLPNLSLRTLASWWILEEYFDNICIFLETEFVKYYVRERQLSKMRIEVSAFEDDSNGHSHSSDGNTEPKRRKLGKMFGAIEKNKERLHIQDYSMSQTSLEQIFNQFASQQDEEKGKAAGIVGSRAIGSSSVTKTPANPKPM